MTTKQPGADDEPRLPDEVWEQFQNDSWGKIDGSAPKEPSARWYEVSDRLSAQPAPHTAPPRRPLRRPRLPEGPVARAFAVGSVFVAVVLVLSAGVAWLEYGRVF